MAFQLRHVFVFSLRYSTDIDRFRNYPGLRNYDSETEIQKLFRPIQKLRLRNYSRRIQKLFSTDSETISPDSETIFDRFRNYFRPIQKLFSKDSETIFDRFRNYFRRIQKLYISTDSETIFDRFRNYDSETIFDRFRNYDSETIKDSEKFFRPIQTLRLASHAVKHFVFIYSSSSLPFFLATHAFNDFPPPCLLGNPCFQWFFKSIFSAPPFLTTHAFNDFLIIKIFPPTLSWQPLLSML